MMTRWGGQDHGRTPRLCSAPTLSRRARSRTDWSSGRRVGSRPRAPRQGGDMQSKNESSGPDYLREEPPATETAPGYGEQPAPGAQRPEGEEVPVPNQSPHADVTYQPPSVLPQDAGQRNDLEE